MGFRLKSAGSISADDATADDIREAFANDAERGEFLILEAPEGGYMQMAGGIDGEPFVLEHRDTSESHFKAKGNLTKADVEDAFLSYLSGDEVWQFKYKWDILEMKKGCLSMAVVLITAAFCVSKHVL